MKKENKKKLIKTKALILAGGKGTRLWPLSRENYPKQFVEFKDGFSLFQLTIKRLLCYFAGRDIFVISHKNYKFTINNQIELIDELSKKIKRALIANVIFEPEPKNTLPAILLSMKYMEEHTPVNKTDVIYVFPSDHIIEPVTSFIKCLNKAKAVAGNGNIVVFGVTPSSPQEGYGYICGDDKISGGTRINRFVEKPSFKKAQTLIEKGALWNAGIFCVSKQVLEEELKKYQPTLYKQYNTNYEQMRKHFNEIQSDSIDYAIMQKTKRAAVVRFDVRWSDLGSWDSIVDFHAKGKENFAIGKAEFVDSKDCFVYAKDKFVCLLGLKDVLVIDTADSLLLIKKGCSGQVKNLVSLINKKGRGHTKDSLTVYRPWGYYTVFYEHKGYKVKEIGVYPQKSLSLQKHKYRSEHWNVVEGEAVVLVDGKEKKVKKNESVFVPKNTKHRVYNPGKKIAKIIEVQIGSYLGEDDIVRYTKY